MSVAAAATDPAVVAGAHAVARAALSGSGPGAPATPVRDNEPVLMEAVPASEVKAGIQAGLEALGGEDDLVPDAVDLPPAEMRGVLEAILLVSTKPLKVERLAKLLPGTHPGYVEGFLAGLAHRYDDEQRGWELRRIGGGWQLLTRVAFHPWVRQLDRKELPSHLTKSAMETLAIVAYKQPTTRGAIEDIRGVQSGPMLRQLMDMKLVAVVGRDEEALGHPLLYGTTEQFLDRFGLASPDDLPKAHELG